MLLEAGKFKIKVPADLVPDDRPLPGWQTAIFPLGPHVALPWNMSAGSGWGRGRDFLQLPFQQGINPIMSCYCSVTQSCWLFAIPRTTTHQASLSFTNSRSLLKLMSIESLVLSRPYILLPDHSHNIHLKLTRLELTIDSESESEFAVMSYSLWPQGL